MKAILHYPGAKHRLAQDIINMFPKHHTYIEPYFGSGAIFFAKEPSTREIINDIDSMIYNFFRTLREQPNELITKIYMTPWSREEHANSFKMTEDDTVENARRFLVGAFMTHAGNYAKSKSWRFYGQKDGGSLPRTWKKLPERLMQASDRLKDAYIEHRDALVLIKQYDFENVLMYLDPPYPRSSINSNSPLYKHILNNDQHHELLNTIKSMKKAMIVISTYENEMYNETLKDWRKIVINTINQKGKQAQEVIFINYDNPIMLV